MTRDTTPITKERAEAIQEWRRRSGLSRKKLAKAVGVSYRTIQKYESPPPPPNHRRRTDDLLKLAEHYGISLDELLRPPSAAQSHGIPRTFAAAIEVAERVDRALLRAVRDLTMQEDAVVSAYRALKNDLTSQHGVLPDGAFSFLQGNAIAPGILGSCPIPDLEVHIDRDFREIVFRSPQSEIVVRRPQLVWDCPCDTPGFDGTAADCPIHRHDCAEDISSRFSNGFVEFHYDEARFLWKQSREFWPPSVDSIHFLSALREAEVLDGKHRSVLDVGSGTGFLGTMVAREVRSIERVAYSDWLLTPSFYSTLNWSRSAPKRFVSVEASTEMFTKAIQDAGEKFDLLVCNPPYLPLRDKGSPLAWASTVAGTDLLCHVIEYGHRIAKRVFVQFSSIAMREAEAAAQRSRCRLEAIGRYRLVPFRVRAAFLEDGYLSFLIDERGIVEKPQSRHRYWHEVSAHEVLPNPPS